MFQLIEKYSGLKYRAIAAALSVCWLTFVSSELGAQSDTAVFMAPVEVTAPRLTKETGYLFVQRPDSQAMSFHLAGDLAEILTREGGVFLKTYGQGSLATSALRGAGASHTAVLWNGFNLQNPMNGVTDFSLFPAGLSDNVGIQHGGGSSLQGSGSIGGTVFLDDRLPAKPGWHSSLAATVGSFGDFRQLGKLGYRNEKWGTSVKLFHAVAKNDFKLNSSLRQRQENAQLAQWALSQTTAVKISLDQTLRSFLWLQKSDRNIPPSRTELNAHARQLDDVTRIGLEWTKTNSSNVLKARAGYFEENLVFFSDVVDTSNSRFRTFIAEAEQAFRLSRKQTLQIGAHFTGQRADTRGTGLRNRFRWAAFGEWSLFYSKEKGRVSLSVRQELVDGVAVPLLASAGTFFQLKNGVKLTAAFSRNYNLPTFNDLYWSDAFARGNPELKPETGWSSELGVRFMKRKGRRRWSARLNAFSNLVDNWILWAPEGQVWSPQNKRKVWARGLEVFAGGEIERGFWHTAIGLNGSITRSTIRRIYENTSPALLNKQLIYTPVAVAGGTVTVTRKKSFLRYGHQFTGQRFTTTDNAAGNALPGFGTGWLRIGTSFPVARQAKAGLQFSVRNIWDISYEVIEARPMPGRHFRLEFRLAFDKKKSR
ncbi:MAG: TonB-dependent receptor [Saprospiraceae bacterium]